MGGNFLIGFGILLIVFGIAFKLDLFSWFGHLPGDLRYEGENFVFLFPFTSMVLVSILISLFLWLFDR